MALEPIHENRCIDEERAEEADNVFPRFGPARDYRDQVVDEFLKRDELHPAHQTRSSPLPPEVDRARRAIRAVANASNRSESNIEQRVKQIYDGPGEHESLIARFADDLTDIEDALNQS
jgi:hypothetical protein